MRELCDNQRQESIKGRTYEPLEGCICQSTPTRTRTRGPYGCPSGQGCCRRSLGSLRGRFGRGLGGHDQYHQFNVSVFSCPYSLARLAVTEQCGCDSEIRRKLAIHSIRPSAGPKPVRRRGWVRGFGRHGRTVLQPTGFLGWVLPTFAQFPTRSASRST